MRKQTFIPVVLLLLLFSCRNSYYTEKDFASSLKIDAHVHINCADGLFEKVAAENNFLLLTINVDHAGEPDLKTQHDIALMSVRDHPGKVFYSASFNFDTAGFDESGWSRKIISRLSENMSAGAVSVKIWKNIGMVVRNRKGRFIMVDDPGLDSVIAYIKSRGIPVTGHLGEPRNCWLPLDSMTTRSDSNYYAKHPEYHMFLHPDYPSYESQIRARDNFLKKNPGLVFIGCHLGSLEWNVDSLAARLDKFPNMAVDMSARVCHLQYQSSLDRERIRNFIIKYQDRLLYGTDQGYTGTRDPDGFRKNIHDTWLSDWKYFSTDDEMISTRFNGKFRGLKLPKEIVDKIFSGNAVKWYRLPV
jgi:predicted TIM-barrel fold metal-dependent hydrolase